ncbi:conserved exported hypothetical protein [Rhodococcus sp. RD6.2]|jgi:hypothetical protein|uniref:hypothetical protein n=1 Tax=Rhodococcus sp. RD6.2 TaxID=260936 RepID=UPI00063B5E11|nr:hypothetical protein [Rhodococcus sp. RD6.2]CRK53745.1 conserved exported hypothetical protein [Rhodococcus sp. RD6.2]
MNDGRRRARKRQQLEMLIGILGFFTLMALIAAVVGIVGGDQGATPSLVLLGLVVALGAAIRSWRRAR